MNRGPLLSVIFLLACAPAQPHRSDGELVSHFDRHEAGFRQLVGMVPTPTSFISITKDGVRDLTCPGPAEPGPVKTELWHRTWPLLGQLGIFRAQRRDDGKMLFLASERGGSSGKGYAYFPRTQPPASSESLDSRTPDCDQTLYKPIRDGWYLFLRSYCL